MDFKLKKNSLNFSVYAVTDFPETANENDIGVVTDIQIANWILSPEEPSGAPRNNGDVWITYSVDGSTVNILKDNVLSIAWISAKQYVDSEWTDVTAKSFHNGEWVDWWYGELYMEGAWFTANTGNWVSLGKEMSSDSYAGKAPDIQENVDSFKIYYASSVNASGMYYLENKIDLTKYTTLHFEGELNPYDGVENRARVQIWRDIGKYTLTDVVAYLARSDLNNGVGSIDISALNGEYHIGFSIYSRSSNVSTITCKKLYLT